MWCKSETFIGIWARLLVNRCCTCKCFSRRYFHGIVCEVQCLYYSCTHVPSFRCRSLLPDIAIAERTSNIRPTKLILRIVSWTRYIFRYGVQSKGSNKSHRRPLITHNRSRLAYNNYCSVSHILEPQKSVTENFIPKHGQVIRCIAENAFIVSNVHWT
jgi:hypothetical protein